MATTPTTTRKVTTHAATAVVAAVTAVALTIFGVDVSHYQTTSQTAGASFTIAKASQGTTYKDPEYATFKANAKAHKVPFGAYHFLMHGNVAAQAKNAFGAVGKDVPLAVDCEWGGKCDFADISGFVSAYRALGGKVTLLYVPKTYWAEIGSPNLAAIKGVQLWNARYLFSGAYPGDNAAAWNGYGGLTVKFLQYSDGAGKLDHDAYKGTKASICTYLQCWTPVATPTTTTVKPTPTASPSPTVSTPVKTSTPVVTPKPVVTPRLRVAYPGYIIRSGQLNSANVKKVQARLKALGYYKGTLDGDFGPKTKASVIAFQKAKHLKATGLVDKTTWVRLFTY